MTKAKTTTKTARSADTQFAAVLSAAKKCMPPAKPSDGRDSGAVESGLMDAFIAIELAYELLNQFVEPARAKEQAATYRSTFGKWQAECAAQTRGNYLIWTDDDETNRLLWLVAQASAGIKEARDGFYGNTLDDVEGPGNG